MRRRRYLAALGAGASLSGCLRLTESQASPGGEATRTTTGGGTDAPSSAGDGGGSGAGAEATTTTTTVTGSLSLSEAWSLDGFVPDVTAHDGRFYALVFAGDRALRAVDPDGTVAWTSDPLPENHFTGGRSKPFAFSDARAFVGLSGNDEVDAGRLFAVSRDDGSVDWQFETPADGMHHNVSAVATAGDLVVCGVDDQGSGSDQEPFVVALDRASGSVQWRTAAFDPSFVVDVVAVSDRLAVLTTKQTYVLDAATGEVTDTLERYVGFTGVAVRDGVLYTGGNPVTAYDLGAGETRWETQVVSPARTPPTLAGDSIFVGTSAGHVIRLDAADGETVWQSRVRTEMREPPVTWRGYVWVTDESGSLYAFRRADGETALDRRPADVSNTRPLAVVDDVLFVGRETATAYRITAA
ncbi:MAG: PQQ-binding-like beta-propeller repeat protein [Halobacteriaceae archaeon]